MDTSLHDPLPGQVLDGRYRVDERIAVGGMATVYRAVDIRLDREIALKIMHPPLAADGAFVERFIREAKSAARLAHPNIVGVLDQGTDGPHVYLAMEYVAGCTLRDVLRDSGALPPRVALDIAEPLLAGLGAAHRAGLVHRDVKPENVLIGDDGRVKVADFGLVRGVDTQTSAATGSLLGTVAYLAPEQIEHGACDTRSDVYACGILLYEMLTGVRPHTGDSAAQVLYAHVHEDVPPPSRAVPGLAAVLDGLVAHAAARGPDSRPQDAAALLALVRPARAALSAEELDAAPPGLPGDAAGHAGPEDPTSVLPRRVPAGTRGGHAASPAAPAPLVDPTTRIELSGAAPGGPEEEPASARSRGRVRPRRALPALIGAVLLAVAAAAGVWYVGSGQFLRTPGVYGLPQAEAKLTLREAGLQVRTVEDFSRSVEEGHVISTDPARGERVRRNSTVTLTVSQGPPVAEVPNLRGLTRAEAEEELAEAGLTPGEETGEFSGEVPRGSVIASDPAAGTQRRPDSAVDLVVSRGAPAEVPDVVGLPEGEALQELTEAGFRTETAGERVHAPQDAGTVAGQSPGPGERAGEGETVTLTVSRGPEMVVVPDVEGMRVNEARQTLREAGFRVNVNRVFFIGEVFDQSVDGGDRAPRGSTITLWVG